MLEARRGAALAASSRCPTSAVLAPYRRFGSASAALYERLRCSGRISASLPLYIRAIPGKLRFMTAPCVFYMRPHDVVDDSFSPHDLGDGLEPRHELASQAPWKRPTGVLVAPWRRFGSALQAYYRRRRSVVATPWGRPAGALQAPFGHLIRRDCLRLFSCVLAAQLMRTRERRNMRTLSHTHTRKAQNRLATGVDGWTAPTLFLLSKRVFCFSVYMVPCKRVTRGSRLLPLSYVLGCQALYRRQCRDIHTL